MNDEAGIAFSRPPSLVLPKPVEWMLTDGRGIRDGKEFFSNLCDRLVESGVPLWRANLSARVLHPQLSAINLIWRRGAEVERILREYAMSQSDAYLNSPIRVIYEGAAGLRRRLDVPDPHLDFPILGELRAAGATDYVAMAVPDWQGQSAALTWASDRPGGFSVADLTLLNDILPLFGLFVERYKADNIANNVLHTYLGAQTGQRVLHGSIRRGEVEAIHAVLWYCDLRGFTALSDAIPADELIELLNAYFEAVGEPVLTRGGEILKFIGDGLLAIFPIADPGQSTDAARRALAAALETQAAVERLPEHAALAGEASLRIVVALHVGTALYGNIGAANRLDFTVIGPAVNLVSRVEAIAKALDQPIVLTDDFVRAYGEPMRSLGCHQLRGLAMPHELFAPR